MFVARRSFASARTSAGPRCCFAASAHSPAQEQEQEHRPHRSVLYTPGSRPRALAKARQAGADALILDLEDAVAPAAKDEARENVRAAVAEWGGCLPGGGCLVTVRVNGADTAWGAADLAMAAASSAHALVLPKVESAAQVRDAAAAIPAASPMRVWAMVETPRGVLNAAAIAGADGRVSALVMGTSDLLKELRGRDTAPGRAALLPVPHSAQHGGEQRRGAGSHE